MVAFGDIHMMGLIIIIVEIQLRILELGIMILQLRMEQIVQKILQLLLMNHHELILQQHLHQYCGETFDGHLPSTGGTHGGV